MNKLIIIPPKSGQIRKAGKEGNSPKGKPKWLRTRGEAHFKLFTLFWVCVAKIRMLNTEEQQGPWSTGILPLLMEDRQD